MKKMEGVVDKTVVLNDIYILIPRTVNMLPYIAKENLQMGLN